MRLYLLSIADVSLILTSLTLEGALRDTGLLIGIAVGILTILKLIQDIKIRKKDNKLKELELKKKEQE